MLCVDFQCGLCADVRQGSVRTFNLCYAQNCNLRSKDICYVLCADSELVSCVGNQLVSILS